MGKPRLQEKYFKEVVPQLKAELGYTSVMQVPRLQKICINQGLGEGVANKKLIQLGIEELTAITGQRAVATYAKRAVSNFKLRIGMPIGVKVTLRSQLMYEFLDRLIAIALPRIRNFWGLPTAGFDSNGNYTIGIQEQIIFPEVSIDKVAKVVGMNVTFVTTAQDKAIALQLLKALGMPFNMEKG
ncbi:MAG: 50S ribosomal protein L5 [Candidatus Cardinium sp.]|uniref:Large ribosomal subunit protein uL5 n=1 Tax=Candidatus Cardinium hertigii TaxID=247481 RepID=A0A2Z3LC55_9BACT|nr:50S ribosomal protein L5 [Candidatus Cardinium hertigii]AWN81752.1 50S ribosomal protein L5 [Candidatus Cardinium hertigii]MDD9139602.1 50S ribosomal protein L5 [Candidatus Cardinium sp.]